VRCLKLGEEIIISADQIDMEASGLEDQSCWEGIGASISRGPVEDSPAADFEYDSELEWDYTEYHILEDINEETDTDIEDAVLSPSIAIATCEAAEEQGILDSKEFEALSLEYLTNEQKTEILQLLAQHQELFDGGEETIGLVPGICHQINTGDAKPTCIRQWRLPHTTKQTIRQQCESMLQAGVIEPSTSPWLSPVVLVKKKDGSLCFFVDYRALNAVTVKDTYPLPRIDALIDELGPMDTFTTLDAKAAYWAVEVEPKDRPKTAFSDGYRLFQFCRLPFGLSTAPTTFQRTMNVLLASVLGKHTLCYLDDVVIYSRGFSQHLKDLQETLTILSAAGLKLDLDKCTFAATTINFLGFTITPEGVLPNKEKVMAISQISQH